MKLLDEILIKVGDSLLPSIEKANALGLAGKIVLAVELSEGPDKKSMLVKFLGEDDKE